MCFDFFHLYFFSFSKCIFQGDVEDDANVPDRIEDIKPRFHRARTQGLGASSHQDNENNNANQQAGNNNNNESDDEEDFGDESDDDSSTEWNLSKLNLFS